MRPSTAKAVCCIPLIAALVAVGDAACAADAATGDDPIALALNPRPQVKDNSIKLLGELGVDVYRDDGS